MAEKAKGKSNAMKRGASRKKFKKKLKIKEVKNLHSK